MRGGIIRLPSSFFLPAYALSRAHSLHERSEVDAFRNAVCVSTSVLNSRKLGVSLRLACFFYIEGD